MRIYEEQCDIFLKMYYLFSNPLIKYIQKLKYQFFNHKSLGWIVLLIAATSIIWSACNITSWIRSVCCYPLSYIIVTGKRYYTTNDDIYRAIETLGTLGTFTTQYINVIQKKIALLPWIQQVSVRIQWPDILKIHIVEHIPIAFWNNLHIISATGTIFDTPDGYEDNNKFLMPILYGPRGSEQEILIYYYIFNEILQKSTKLQMKSLKVDMRSSWEIVLKNNMYIKLGRNNIIERINYFIKIYPILLYKSNESNKYVDYVDLRYTTGFVVKWIPNTITSILCKK